MHVTDRFEVWVAESRRAEERRARKLGQALKECGTCDSCGAEDEELPNGEYCLACCSYSFGYDQAEHTVGFGIVRGAVRTALEMGVDRETVIAATMDALDRDSDWAAPNVYGNVEAS